MRVLGVWGNGLTAHALCDQLAELAARDSSSGLSCILRPRSAVLVQNHLPAISIASDGEGFAVLDGEVSAIGPLSGGSGWGPEGPARTVLELYRRKGTVALRDLNGTASVAIWDAREERLLLARDRVGLSLCYWMERNGALVWSSELVELLRSDDRTELDLDAIDLFVASGFVSAPWTTLKHIRKLPSAHVLIADRRGIRIERYWRQTGQPKLRLKPAEAEAALSEKLWRAHRRQLPLGGEPSAALLSGGVDSMLMVAALAKLGCRPESFTYRYKEYEGKFNESERACRAALAAGVPHCEMPVGPADISQNLDTILLQHQGPLTYGAHTAILRAVSQSGAKILYTGQGNGGPSQLERAGLLLGRVPLPHAPLARMLDELGSGLGSEWLGDAAYLLRVAATGLSWRTHAPLTSDSQRRSLYAEPERLRTALAARAALFRSVVDEFEGESGVDRFCGAMQRLYTADGTLHWTVSFARAHALLPRCPYYDAELVDFMYRLPRQLDKRDIRAFAATLLPAELAYAPKLGQTIPIGLWFRGSLAPWLRECLDSNRIAAAGLFRPDAVQSLFYRHLAGLGEHGWTLWIIATLTAWQEIVNREAGRYLPLMQQRAAVG